MNATPSKLSKRINIYARTPAIIAAHRMAVELGLIKASSTDARIEKLLGADLRKITAELKAKKHKLSPADAEIMASAMDEVAVKRA